MPRFVHFPNRPKSVTAPFVAEQYAKLLAMLPAAERSDLPDKWFELFRAWNDFGSYIGSEGARIQYELSKNMNDEKLSKAEEYFRNEIEPLTDQPEHELVRAFLASKHKSAMAKEFGEQLIPDFESAIKPLDPVNTKLRTKIGEICNSYDKLLASALVDVNGQTITLSKARSLGNSSDQKVREAAYRAIAGWILNNHDEMGTYFNQLTKLRDQMGKNVGYESFTPLAYESMCRTDYDAKIVETFRNQVKEFVVPIRLLLAERQKKNLGVKTLAPWNFTINNLAYNPETSLPLGIVPTNKQLDQTQRLFDKLSPKLGGYFNKMRQNNLIDLENRPGKRAGAFSISFNDEKQEAIFLNSTGDADDIHTMTHEMGHAFQGWESQDIEIVGLQRPTPDLCEVHSIGMEFLSLPYIEEYFDKGNADKFRKNLWWQAVDTLCYVSLVDEFQHWVYNNPNSTIDERDSTWVKLMDDYCPGIDWSVNEDYKKTRWYIQHHIFDIPFYYIDYAIAETGAMQLAMMDAVDHEKTMKTYMELCRIGGTKSVLKAFKSAELRSPFDPTLMKDLMDYTSKQLELQ